MRGFRRAGAAGLAAAGLLLAAFLGWDRVTGLGSPDAQWLVPLLANFAQH